MALDDHQQSCRLCCYSCYKASHPQPSRGCSNAGPCEHTEPPAFHEKHPRSIAKPNKQKKTSAYQPPTHKSRKQKKLSVSRRSWKKKRRPLTGVRERTATNLPAHRGVLLPLPSPETHHRCLRLPHVAGTPLFSCPCSRLACRTSLGGLFGTPSQCARRRRARTSSWEPRAKERGRYRVGVGGGRRRQHRRGVEVLIRSGLDEARRTA